ncbi:MAG TPA: hypothetical protein VGX16_01390 [Solirubrobacteraceae bacterium]|jgi:hypothetical protein|nr:hypothetical protein [Solirubrobacteraceae bacterium]
MSHVSTETPPETAPANDEGDLRAENERLRSRLEALESELVEVQARANAEVARWEERAYWLERWQIDLNAIMRRPGALPAMEALRSVRGVWWRLKRLKRRLLNG